MRRDDTGTVSAFAACLCVALLLCAGLVLDGARIVDARLEAADLAGAAARAGAQATVGIRASSRGIDPAAASAAAQQVLAAAGQDGTVVIEGDRVIVTVSVRRDMAILGLAGVGPRTVSARRSARAVDGEAG
jgi:hypothetical protein